MSNEVSYVQIQRRGNRPRYTAVHIPTGETVHDDTSHLQAIQDAEHLRTVHECEAYDHDGTMIDD